MEPSNEPFNDDQDDYDITPLPSKKNNQLTVIEDQLTVVEDQLTVAEDVTPLPSGQLGLRTLVLESWSDLRVTRFALLNWTNAWKAINALAIGIPLGKIISNLQVVSTVRMADRESGDHEVHYMRRMMFLETLAKDLPPGTIRFYSKVVSIEEARQRAGEDDDPAKMKQFVLRNLGNVPKDLVDVVEKTKLKNIASSISFNAQVAMEGVVLGTRRCAVSEDILFSGDILNSNEFIENGPYRFIMQSDCNLVLYMNRNRVLWNSATNGRGTSCRATLQNNGNLVILSGTDVVWSSQSAQGPNNYRLIIQGDGNVVIYGASLWATNTVQSRRRLLAV
ncbi:hypothetical protein IFM89_035468 [Coptis chinensis]|uniref:Bulb-type lectin domain-containing protein n=1 Tax=Coptis chinensis TaxID=261450 RepID=A0A835GZJ9_9MAGN|nr:hypothetical protein IFM89_035468 [Coptis chinensis]